MTTKSLSFALGSNLESHALRAALYPLQPNPRSPAFAIQAIFKVLKEAGIVTFEWDFEKKLNKKRIDEYIQDRVTWNDIACHWQVGKGTNIPFKNIVEVAIRWYVNDWDLKRHTRDSEIKYPEDSANFYSAKELDHLAQAMMPASDEITRRIFVSSKNKSSYCYLDVAPNGNGRFSAEFGLFNNRKSHRTLAHSNNFWSLEVNTILPLLKDVDILSYTVHHHTSKMGV